MEEFVSLKCDMKVSCDAYHLREFPCLSLHPDLPLRNSFIKCELCAHLSFLPWPSQDSMDIVSACLQVLLDTLGRLWINLGPYTCCCSCKT